MDLLSTNHGDSNEGSWSKVWPAIGTLVTIVIAILTNQLLASNPTVVYSALGISVVILVFVCAKPVAATYSDLRSWHKAKGEAELKRQKNVQTLSLLNRDLTVLREVITGEQDYSFNKLGREARLSVGWESTFIKTSFDYLMSLTNTPTDLSIIVISQSLQNFRNYLQNRLNGLEQHFMNETGLSPEEGLALVIKNRQSLTSFIAEYNSAISAIRKTFAEHDGRYAPDSFRFLVLPDVLK
jgi:hypothetical protein